MGTLRLEARSQTPIQAKDDINLTAMILQVGGQLGISPGETGSCDHCQMQMHGVVNLAQPHLRQEASP